MRNKQVVNRARMFLFHRYKWVALDLLLIATTIGAIVLMVSLWVAGLIYDKDL
jgi:hypothetical protein